MVTYPAMLTPFEPPPEDYYQQNCVAVCEFVLQRYAGLLQQDVVRNLHAFLTLGDDPQRLLARLLTRKGPLFRLDALNYTEIADIRAALCALEQIDFVQWAPCIAADSALALLRKGELTALFPERLSARMKKTDMIACLCAAYSDRQLCQRVAVHYPYIALTVQDTWRRAQFLFFGTAHQDWSAFVTRDLGMMCYEEVPLHAQFDSSAELNEALKLADLSSLSHRVADHTALTEALLEQLLKVRYQNRWLRQRHHRIVLRLARQSEREENFELALRAYEAVPRHPSRERRVRIQAKTGNPACVKHILEDIRRHPWSEEEQQFAARFGKRNRGFQPDTEVYDINEVDTSASIESQAMSILVVDDRVAWAAHVENRLLRTLTGLIYWPVIFSDAPGAFTNPFQTAPNDLFADDFVASRAERVDKLERQISDDHALITCLHDTYRCKVGVANALVSWRLLAVLPLQVICAYLPARHIRQLAAYLIRNLRERRTGLPDLLVAFKDGSYAFVEVKGPNDQLQPGQRVWLKKFAELDIPAHVMRLKCPSN